MVTTLGNTILVIGISFTPNGFSSSPCARSSPLKAIMLHCVEIESDCRESESVRGGDQRAPSWRSFWGCWWGTKTSRCWVGRFTRKRGSRPKRVKPSKPWRTSPLQGVKIHSELPSPSPLSNVSVWGGQSVCAVCHGWMPVGEAGGDIAEGHSCERLEPTWHPQVNTTCETRVCSE